MPDPVILRSPRHVELWVNDRMDLTSLEDHEHLWLMRRRLFWTQSRAARHYKMSRQSFAKQERGLLPLTLKVYKRAPSVREQIALARRRYGKTLLQIAAEFKISHVTLLSWEQRHPERMVDFWSKAGFTFVKDGTTVAAD